MINLVGVTTEEHLVSYFKRTRLIDVVLLASKLNTALVKFYSIEMTAPDAKKADTGTECHATCGWTLKAPVLGCNGSMEGLWSGPSKQLSCGVEQKTH